MNRLHRWLLLACLLANTAQAGLPEGARCIAPAKGGGGFDLTCQLVRDMLQAAGQTRVPLAIAYQPGGIGALAFHSTVTQRPADGQTIVAFSSGSLLNLAQGRFGPYSARDVRWLAALGMDYGVVAVRQDAPYRSLRQLLDALRSDPNRIVFGAGGAIGSQDWMKAALLARAAGVSHKSMRFVAFEGGGEALTALRGDHVQVLAGDAAEVGRQIEQGVPVRVLAVLSSQRLPGRWAQVPTAKEQGFDIQWPIVRGVYLGPQVSEREARDWNDALARAAAHPALAPQLVQAGLQPGWVSGPALDALVARQTAEYQRLAAEFGLARRIP
nr:tripartite tricarboxylate transporter substrate-binding protein [uncultured Albidiferax sp.]